jgi:predicted RNase H-like nuclease
LLLYEEGLHVPDPMHVFEEWTRHHILAGRMSLDNLYGHNRLDALVAAFTAYLLAEEPERTTSVGDPTEGAIVVPTTSLKERYP